jgi:putative tryptophan/tyrosine transport system substrate-binding protein
MIGRRDLLLGVAGAVFSRPSLVLSQAAQKTHRIGLMFSTIPAASMAGPVPAHQRTRVFLQALRDAGYAEGGNIIVERRSAEGRPDRYAEIAAALVAGGVDVMVTAGNTLARATLNITRNVPVVVVGDDPVADGLIASVARPGGNITGATVHAGPEFEAKRLQLLRETVPTARRIAYLGAPSDWSGPFGMAVRSEALKLGIDLLLAPHGQVEYAEAFAVIIRERVDALYVARNTANIVNAPLIWTFATEKRLPAMFPYRDSVLAGGLMSYGANLDDVWRHAADLVVRIMRGDKAGDLPIEQPTRYELAINLKTARALGLELPTHVLARADEVIE